MIKKPRQWKLQLILAEIVAVLMPFFLGVSLASAATIFQTSSYVDALDGANEFNNYFSGVLFQSESNATSTLNYGTIATSTMAGASVVYRWAPFAPASFTGAEPIKIHLRRNTGSVYVTLDCATETFIPNQVASSGVPTLVNFSFSGTQCDLYDFPRDIPYLSYFAPTFQWGFVTVPGYSGAAYSSALKSDGGAAYLIYDNDGPTNPDLLPTEPVQANPIDFQTKFTNALAKGISSTTVSFDVDYFLNTAEYTAQTRPDYISVQVLANGFFSDQQVTSANKIILPLSDGPGSKNIPTTYNFPDGDYLAYFNFWNINTNSITFANTGIVISFEVSGGAVINSTIEELYTGEEISETVTYVDCGLDNITGCLTNALIFTFVPSDGSLSKFTTLYTKIEKKPPFGYVTALKNALTGVNASAPAAFDFGTIPFQSTIFDPFKAIMVIGLWLLYALFFMGRLNKLDI